GRSLADGALVCTAAVDEVVQPGRPIPMTMTITNRGDSAAHVPSWGGAEMTVRDADGSVVWDTAIASAFLGPGPDLFIELPAGGSRTYEPRQAVFASWGGPLVL